MSSGYDGMKQLEMSNKLLHINTLWVLFKALHPITDAKMAATWLSFISEMLLLIKAECQHCILSTFRDLK